MKAWRSLPIPAARGARRSDSAGGPLCSVGSSRDAITVSKTVHEKNRALEGHIADLAQCGLRCVVMPTRP
jgi:hypothetical protein